MKGIEISQTIIHKWENNLSLLANLSKCSVTFWTANGQRFELVCCSDGYQEGNTVPEHYELHAHQAMLGREMVFSSPDPVSKLNIAAFPVEWANQFLYGALILSSNEHPLTPEALMLAENVCCQLGRDLTAELKTSYTAESDPVFALDSDQADFQSFIDSIQDHIWVKDLNGVYIHCNRAAYTDWKELREDVVGKTDPELFDKEISTKFLGSDDRVLRGGKQEVIEECADKNDPSGKTWRETIKAPLIGKNGGLAGIIGMTRNVTGRKQIEEQLMVAGTVFENSVEGVVITDRWGDIAYVNQAFCSITGYSQAEVIGRNPKLLKSGRHSKEYYDDMWKSLTEEGRWQGEIWNRRKDGAIYPELTTISVVYDEDGEPSNYVAVFIDISLQKQNEAELVHMAYHDPLTDLPNRQKLTSQIEREISHAKRNLGRLATLFIDIDHFKHINDTYGHLIGDEVLCEVADRLRNTLREDDTVARIGGDEFVILAGGFKNLEAVTTLVSKLMFIFDAPVELSNGEKHRLTGSVGVSLYPDDGTDSDTLLRNADAAMYRAKQNGRNNYAFYTQSLTEESESHLRLQGAMHDALEKNAFHLVFQPQYNIKERKVTGVEALMRWEDPLAGSILPSEFIPVAEKTTLINEIGQWVLFNACSQGVQWLNQGYDFGRIAVNVAGPQLMRNEFAESVIKILEITGLPPENLELEVTEGSMMDHNGCAVEHLNKLRGMGIEIAVDDFGTGYSSLSYLNKLPLDKIKIDRSFVMNIPYDPHSIAIAEAVILLGKSLSLKVIAEGIENSEQLQVLSDHGCTEAQGYYLGKPMIAEEIEELFK